MAEGHGLRLARISCSVAELDVAEIVEEIVASVRGEVAAQRVSGDRDAILPREASVAQVGWQWLPLTYETQRR